MAESARETVHRGRVRLGLLLVAAAVLGCEEQALGSAYDLSGFVYTQASDDGARSPVTGAEVTFRSDTGITAQTVTDDGGRYRLRVVSDVQLGQVRAERSGFETDERTVYFDTPERRIDLRLRPSAD